MGSFPELKEYINPELDQLQLEKHKPRQIKKNLNVHHCNTAVELPKKKILTTIRKRRQMILKGTKIRLTEGFPSTN